MSSTNVPRRSSTYRKVRSCGPTLTPSSVVAALALLGCSGSQAAPTDSAPQAELSEGASGGLPACGDLRRVSEDSCRQSAQACTEDASRCDSARQLCSAELVQYFRECSRARSCAYSCAPKHLPEPDQFPSIGAEVVEMYESGCRQKSADACAFLAWLYDHGVGVDRNPMQRVALLVDACAEDSAEGCYELGMVFYRGYEAAPPIPERAIPLFERACALDPSRCTALAAAYIDGEGTRRDVMQGNQLLSRACEAKNDVACRLEACSKQAAKAQDVNMRALFECAGYL